MEKNSLVFNIGLTSASLQRDNTRNLVVYKASCQQFKDSWPCPGYTPDPITAIRRYLFQLPVAKNVTSCQIHQRQTVKKNGSMTLGDRRSENDESFVSRRRNLGRRFNRRDGATRMPAQRWRQAAQKVNHPSFSIRYLWGARMTRVYCRPLPRRRV